MSNLLLWSACLGACWYFAGTHPENLFKSLVTTTTSRITYFVPLSHTGNRSDKANAAEQEGEDLDQTKTKMNGQEMQKLGQAKRSWQWPKHAWLYSDQLQALKRKTSVSSVFSTGALFCVWSTPLWEAMSGRAVESTSLAQDATYALGKNHMRSTKTISEVSPKLPLKQF